MLIRAFLAASLALAATPAVAQTATGSEFVTATPGQAVSGVMMMCLNGSNVAVPCSGNGSTSTNVTIVGPDGLEGGVSVAVNPFRENATQRAGSMTVGGSWQQIAPVNLLRQRFFVQNPCSATTQGIATTESLFLTFSATLPPTSPLAAPVATELVTCGSFDTSSSVVGTNPVFVWAATIDHRFQAIEW